MRFDEFAEDVMQAMVFLFIIVLSPLWAVPFLIIKLHGLILRN